MGLGSKPNMAPPPIAYNGEPLARRFTSYFRLFNTIALSPIYSTSSKRGIREIFRIDILY